MSDLLKAAQTWRDLAARELRLAEIEVRYGSVESYHVRAKIFVKTAEALEYQEKTGIAICSCCHKPLGKHPKNGILIRD